MSLLDRTPHTVQVQLRAIVEDTLRGKSLPLSDVGSPISVGCTVQPLSSTDLLVLGGNVGETQRNIISRTWPGDTNSVVYFDGFQWDTIGDPQHHHMSPATAHWEIRIQKGKAHV
jgi:hypothetical protein